MAALALALGLMLAVLDATMINVGLPSIAESLNASASTVVWVVNAYSLTVAMTLLPMAAIGERIIMVQSSPHDGDAVLVIVTD